MSAPRGSKTRAVAESPLLRRLRAHLRKRALPPELASAIQGDEECQLEIRDAHDELEGCPGLRLHETQGFRNALERAKAIASPWLREGRDQREREARRQRRLGEPPLAPDRREIESWLDPGERLRVQVLNRELARLAMRLGYAPSDGEAPEIPGMIPAFRREWLGGKTLKPAEAHAFMGRLQRSDPDAEELRRIGRALARHYLWDETEACWFVLTEEPPYPPYFRMRLDGGYRHDHEQYRVSLSVPPWVSATSWARMLKVMQARLLGRASRPLSPQRLRLVDFVAPQLHRGKSWHQVRLAWNRKYPKNEYTDAEYANFHRDFSQTYRLLMRSSVRLKTPKQRRRRRRP